jgi:hypothetical protein
LEEDGCASDNEEMGTDGDFLEWAGCHSLVGYHQRYCRTIGNPLQSEGAMKERSRDEKLNGYLHVHRHDSNLFQIDEKNEEPELLYVVCGCRRTENGQQIQETEVVEQPTVADHWSEMVSLISGNLPL